MPITLVSTSSADSAASNSLSITAPASIVANNILLAVVGTDGAAITAPFNFNTPDTGGGGTGVKLEFFTKLATGSEPGSYTWSVPSGHKLCCLILQYSGVNTATFAGVNGIDGSPTYQYNGGTLTNATAPTITPSQAGDLWVAGFMNFNGETWSTPTGFTARASDTNATNLQAIAAFDQQLSGSGATGSATSNMSGAATNAVGGSLLLKAAPAAYAPLAHRTSIVPHIRASCW